MNTQGSCTWTDITRKSFTILCWARPPVCLPSLYLTSHMQLNLPGLPPSDLHTAKQSKTGMVPNCNSSCACLGTSTWADIAHKKELHDHLLGTSTSVSTLSLPDTTHATKSPRPPSFRLAYCKQSKTGGCDNLVHYSVMGYVLGTTASIQAQRVV